MTFSLYLVHKIPICFVPPPQWGGIGSISMWFCTMGRYGKYGDAIYHIKRLNNLSPAQLTFIAALGYIFNEGRRSADWTSARRQIRSAPLLFAPRVAPVTSVPNGE